MTQLDVFDLYRQGDYAAVEELAANPGKNVFLWWLRGRMKLARGENGWTDLAMARYPQENEWAGEDLDGKVLLIKQQEGFGDQIMYARWIPDLLARAKEVWMEPVAKLERLFCWSFPELLWGVPEKYNYITGTGAGQWAKPAGVPYLNFPLTMPKARRRGRLRVGLTWNGNQEYPFNNDRSLIWDDFKPLLSCDADFFTLQFDHPDIPGIPNLASGCKDFADTACVLKDLDLLITTCTAMPNLAGALGYPKVWLILRDPIDFRWGLPAEREDWYPGIRQFRNASMHAVREALKTLIERRSCELTSVGSF